MEDKPVQDTQKIYNLLFGFYIIKTITKTAENLIIINQIARSVTSMGADREADGVTTKRFCS